VQPSPCAPSPCSILACIWQDNGLDQQCFSLFWAMTSHRFEQRDFEGAIAYGEGAVLYGSPDQKAMAARTLALSCMSVEGGLER
jgi:hypothetical protein